MPKTGVRWKLGAGFSDLLRQGEVEFSLEDDPLRHRLSLSPWQVLEREEGFRHEWRLRKGVRGKGPGGLTWSVTPEMKLLTLLLAPGEAYLGNYRVPQDAYGIQWTIRGEVAGEQQLAPAFALLSCAPRSLVNYSWVQTFRQDQPLRSLLEKSWKSFPDPFDPAAVAALDTSQVVYFAWSGTLRIGLRMAWRLAGGWQGALESGLFRLGGSSRLWAGVSCAASFRRRGSFSLRLARRRGRLQLTLSRLVQKDTEASWELSVGALGRMNVGSPIPGTEPLGQRLEEKLNQAVHRRLSLLVSAISAHSSRRKTLVRVEWSDGSTSDLENDLSEIFASRLIASREGVKVSGTWEDLRRTRRTLRVHLLHLFDFHREEEDEIRERVTLTPTGGLLIERTRALQRLRSSWSTFQWLRVSRNVSTEGEESLYLSLRLSREWREDRLFQLLRALLHSSVIPRFHRRPGWRFPANLTTTWLSRLSAAAIREVRTAAPEAQWQALIRALELSEPQRYGASSPYRDWIRSEELREVIEKRPVQAALSSYYPVPGRSSFERIQVVREYRQVRFFLQLCEKWREGGGSSPLALFQHRLDLPLFLFFHLLSSEGMRRSVVLIEGDFRECLGAQDLWESPDWLDEIELLLEKSG